ncbi:sodium-coupled monocarboxylate transporter 1-like isoform X2 [Schistocerca gregaria]|uniref:sodium-coupled monocarboxylate transporter 1-like isoform X2 n=1 Tax=Schistocerca gregaria TaxID=7010 RepID=UPI00211F1122|nr:sodium-coupled monocarboxylate transporter 1-like isoform X2 [Schistocerca gregaria]
MAANVTAAAAGVVGRQVLFGWVDYVAFALMPALSVAIGLYFGICGRAKNTAKVDYLHGGKTMRVLPVAISQISSHVSGSTLVGVPSEIYLYGSVYTWICLSVILFSIVTNFVFLPVFFELQLTSTYEYLERRFSRIIRVLASGLFTLNMVLHLPLYLYTPAICFSQVTGVSVHWITPVICVMCILYTMLGGLKAVVWTDFLQSGVTLMAFIAVLVLGLVGAGGFSQVWQAASEGGRADFFVMTPDPFVRNSFWTVVVGATVSWVGGIAVHQGMVQKFLSLPNMRAARKSLAGFTFGMILIHLISIFCGFLLYADYQDCDPIKTKEISRPDQLLPFYVMKVAGHVPGLPGLFVAGIFGAALSSMSGCLNALSGTIYEDFLLPLMPGKKSDVVVNLIMQSIVLVVGAVTVALVFVVEKLGTVLELGYSIGGVTNGALLGLFTLGMLVPSANTKGAVVGSLLGMAVVAVILTGAQHAHAMGRIRYPPLPTSIEGCAANFTSVIETVATSSTPSPATDEVPLLFRLSYMYYTLLGAVVMVTVGWAVSQLTGPLKPGDVEPSLLAPMVRPKQRRREDGTGDADPVVKVELLQKAKQQSETVGAA